MGCGLRSESIFERVVTEMSIPSALDAEVRAKAAEMSVSYEDAIASLLRLGLDAQKQREAELDELVDRFRGTEDEAERKRLGHELGGAIFG